LSFVNLTAGGDCSGTSTGLIPLTELTGTYFGHAGFLYDGTNQRPQLLTDSAPPLSPINGKIVMASLGMSNAEQEFRTFMDLFSLDESVNPAVELVNTAVSGCVARATVDPAGRCWRAFQSRLHNAGFDFQDVQVLWVKTTSTTRGTVFPASKDWLLQDLRGTLDAVAALMPNLKQVYVSSRIYGGYASTMLNPEPYAYESAFAFKELVRTQHPGLWISWGPYLWADGLNVRSDGLFWECDDFMNDGTHPSVAGSLKVAHHLMDFFKNDEVTRRWFAVDGAPPDPSGEGFSSQVQQLIDDLRGRRISLAEIISRLEEIRDLLVASGL
jgi:hypothetical protein